MNTPAVTRTEVSRIAHAPVTSTAPNGSSTGTDYWTTVVIREEWADVPENGVYAGRVYRITRNYISTDPHHIGQLAGSSSSPWVDDQAEDDAARDPMSA